MVATCHALPQEATEAQQRRQFLLCVSGTRLSPSHAHCFGVPDLVESPLPMPMCQTADNSTCYHQQTWCCDTVGRNPTLVTSRQHYVSWKAACDKSTYWCSPKAENGSLVSVVPCELPCSVNTANTGFSGSSHSWQLRYWSPEASASGWWTPRRMPNLLKS